MTSEVISIAPDASLADVVTLMEARNVKRLPVVERGQLVGIVSRADLLRALLQLLPGERAVHMSDADIRRQVLAEIDRQPWAPGINIDAVVQDGIVELRGCITDQRERTGLRVIAENIKGVRGISDHLVWIEPMSGTVLDSSGAPPC